MTNYIFQTQHRNKWLSNTNLNNRNWYFRILWEGKQILLNLLRIRCSAHVIINLSLFCSSNLGRMNDCRRSLNDLSWTCDFHYWKAKIITSTFVLKLWLNLTIPKIDTNEVQIFQFVYTFVLLYTIAWSKF